MPPLALTPEQKRSLYDEGYVVLRGVVPRHLTEAANRAIDNAVPDGAQHMADPIRALGGEGNRPDLTSIGNHAATEISDLINHPDSALTPILREAMGDFDPIWGCQVTATAVSTGEPSRERYNNHGYPEADMPYSGASMHIDGQCTIGVPQEVQTGTPEERYHRYISSGPKGDLGRSPEVVGNNFVPLFQDPSCRLSLGSFTCFVGVCLNDQTIEGRGQLAVLPRAHHALERFLRKQREGGGIVGMEGEGWPRLDYNAPNGCGLNVRSLPLRPPSTQSRTLGFSAS